MCLTRMLWYTFLSMMPSIFTKSPVPEAEMAPHHNFTPSMFNCLQETLIFICLPLPPSNIHSSLVAKLFKLELISPQKGMPIFLCPFLSCTFQALHSIFTRSKRYLSCYSDNKYFFSQFPTHNS